MFHPTFTTVIHIIVQMPEGCMNGYVDRFTGLFLAFSAVAFNCFLPLKTCMHTFCLKKKPLVIIHNPHVEYIQ